MKNARQVVETVSSVLEQRPDFNLIKQAVAICDRIDRRCERMQVEISATEKPEVDLQSWRELGKGALPKRVYSRRRHE
jgi:hypothetical protein